MILVDQPNTLIVYSKRDNLRDANISSPKVRSRSASQEGEGNVRDSPEQNYIANQLDERAEKP
jgi:hypothetical protein